ncbi:putative membrane protein [Actinoplanes octamycinicus]|uniref:Putative membrane protein n=1 Tax=Actinoplanes octamycinicus TaxID=135948 RepID=A0A7W7GTT7_9ACTN|nr:glycosyltransferase 87 family protein [Actinoplanes octamycinicus]MBB4738097.1 putative membrane protein [Actinoplanes octamycinicus]GIE59350.1 membrane protein [Actinoplanes octamycinicus]
MSTQPSTDRPDVPSATSDGFVRGLSQFIGGPLGSHATRPDARPGRFWTAPRIIMALTCLILAFSWVQKSPCMSGDWQKNVQYTRFCYTDVLALYYAEGLSDGAVPYVDHQVEYPVVTGYFMGALGLPVHWYGVNHPDINQGSWFYNVNALVLSLFAVITVAVILALRRRRPWDAAIFALSPIILVTATVNWDFLAIGLAAIGLLLWVRKHPIAAGVLLGLGGAAKLWPLFILGPLLIIALRSGRLTPWFQAMAGAVVAWGVANFPVWYWQHEAWLRFFRLNSERPIDWGTLWYIGRYLDGKWSSSGGGPFQWLSDHVPTLNWVTYALFGLACVGLLVLGLLAPQPPRLAQLAFLVVAFFLIFSKVWSQQYVLWLVPLIVLARPKWGAILAWTVAEIGYFAAFYAELIGAGGKPVIPEGTFVLASTLRLVTVAVLCGLVIREIWRPELDVVRQTYGGADPDAGPAEGPDDGWVQRLRSSFGVGAPSPSPVVVPPEPPSVVKV